MMFWNFIPLTLFPSPARGEGKKLYNPLSPFAGEGDIQGLRGMAVKKFFRHAELVSASNFYKWLEIF